MNTATTTCNEGVSSTICTTETIQNFVGGYSYGEVFIILILLMIFTLIFFDKIKLWVFGIKVENSVRIKYKNDL